MATQEVALERAVGIRALRDRLTRYVAQARRGNRLVVTDRGAPVAMLLPYRDSAKGAGAEARLAALLASGHVTPAERAFRKRLAPIRGAGRLPSRIIVESRR